jgi:hypothetical protein
MIHFRFSIILILMQYLITKEFLGISEKTELSPKIYLRFVQVILFKLSVLHNMIKLYFFFYLLRCFQKEMYYKIKLYIYIY